MALSINQTSCTETSVTIKWTSSTKAYYCVFLISGDYRQIDLGNAKSGTFEITGLPPGLYTSLTIDFYSQDGLRIGDATATISTVYYPYAKSAPSFILGTNLTIQLYNPLKRTCMVEIYYSSSRITYLMVSGTSVTFSSSSLDSLYAKIPNSKTGQYRVEVTALSHTDSKTGTFSVNVNAAAPEIGTISYEDINATTLAVTGDSQNIVQSLSQVRYTVTGITPKKSSAISSVWIVVNGVRTNLTYSSGTATGGSGTINSSQNVTGTVYVQDSRGIQTAKDVTITMQEHKVSATFDLQREDNYYSASLLTVYATWNEFGYNVLTITAMAYRVDDPTVTVDIGNLLNEVTKNFTIDNNYDWTIQIKVKDSLSSWVTYTGFLGKGIPIIFFDTSKSSIGINCFPQYDRSLEVDGIIIDKSAITLKGDQYASGSRNMKVPFNSNKTFGKRLSVYNGGIKIGNGITRVMVSFHAFMEAYVTNTFTVVKNSFSQANTLVEQESSFAGEDASSHQYYEVNAMPQLVEVQEGDVLYLYVTDYKTIPEVMISNSYLTIQVG